MIKETPGSTLGVCSGNGYHEVCGLRDGRRVLLNNRNQLFLLTDQEGNGLLVAEERKVSGMKTHARLPTMKDITGIRKAFFACMNVSHDCNLRCEYCYAYGGSYQLARELMKKESAIETLVWIRDHIDTDLINVLLFGGEPMLNMNAISEIRNNEKLWSRGAQVEYSLTTNGTLLTDELFNLFDGRIAVTVSLDGPDKKDNLLRRFSDGESAFHQIINQIGALSDKNRSSLRIRMTIHDGYADITNKIKK